MIFSFLFQLFIDYYTPIEQKCQELFFNDLAPDTLFCHASYAELCYS